MLAKLKSKMAELSEAAKQAAIQAEQEFEKIKLPEDIRNARYDECKKCENFFHATSTCKKCGCFMFAKTYIPISACPVGKWGAVETSKITTQEIKL